MNNPIAKNDRLKSIIKEKAIVRKSERKIVSQNGKNTPAWLIDLRSIFFDPEALNLIAEVFWEQFEKEYPFQVGGQEVAAIPIVSAIVLKSQEIGKPVNGFIIRKSRKHTGLQKIIEGNLTDDKIILVDDLINSGLTIMRQLEVLKSAGRKAEKVFTLVNYQPQRNQQLLSEQQVDLIAPFTLDDFDLPMSFKTEEVSKDNFEAVWRFQSPDPNYFHRVSKSAPAIDDKRVYFGSDNGIFWAIYQKNGSVAWKFKTGEHAEGKGIFSDPVVHKDAVYFGSYDGNFYALDRNNGKLIWKYMDADFIGSSPAIAPDLEMIFVGLEFGLFKKQGGIVALDFKGKKIWESRMSQFVHCSPAYCAEKKVVAIGGNDHQVYLFDAKTGKLKWKFKTGGEVKASLVFDTDRNLLLFGSFDKNLYALDIDTGEVKGKMETGEIIYSTPKVYKGDVFFSSLDKYLYSMNLDSGELNWKYSCESRIFSSPEIADGKILIGANNGMLYEIDPATGKTLSIFIATERITNRIAYNPETKHYFVPTYANEIYCLKKKGTE